MALRALGKPNGKVITINLNKHIPSILKTCMAFIDASTVALNHNLICCHNIPV